MSTLWIPTIVAAVTAPFAILSVLITFASSRSTLRYPAIILAEFNVPIWSATQLNRSGSSNADPGMGDISESFATAFGADLILALISTDQMKALGHVMIKQLKNRYEDLNKCPSFYVQIFRSKMKIEELIAQPFTQIENKNTDDLPF